MSDRATVKYNRDIIKFIVSKSQKKIFQTKFSNSLREVYAKLDELLKSLNRADYTIYDKIDRTTDRPRGWNYLRDTICEHKQNNFN